MVMANAGFPPSMPPGSPYTEDMASQPDIYTLAQRMIDCFGAEAEAYADAMLRRRLEQDDVLAAGAWLALGNAIDDLQQLPPPHRRH
jgi:hypothetical protein